VSTTLAIRISGINAPELESGNAGMCAGRVLPWLQDTKAANVWGRWQVDFRDLVVLNAENKVTAIYNLTVNDLQIPAKYDSLRTLLIRAAAPTPAMTRVRR